MIFYLIISVILALLFMYLLILIRIRTNPMYNKVATWPSSGIVFGVLLDYMQSDCRLLHFIKDSMERFGAINVNFVCWGKARLNISEPKWIKYVLNSKNFQRGQFPAAEDIFIGVGDNGLIVVNGDTHKRLRKIASPAFKLTTIKKVMPTIEMCGKRMINLFLTKCRESSFSTRNDEERKTEVEIKEIMNKTTLDVIGLIAFGHDFEEALSFRKDTFGSDMRESLDLQLSILCIFPYQLPIKRFIMKIMKMLPLWFYRMCKSNRAIIRCHTAHRMHDLVDKIVQEKIAERRQSRWSESKSKSLLDFMLDGAAEVNPQEIHDLLMTFLIAGHETSSLGVTWALYLLAKHPDYQVRCREEAQLFFQQHPENVEWDKLKQMTWINAVVHEQLRLYPPVPWVHRVSINSDNIDGHFIPANTDTLLITAQAQRHPGFWTNPDEFLPERFFDFEAVPWDAFMPFGDGPHKCIGYQLALTEITYFLAVILKNFEFSIDPNVDYHEYAIITMQPKPPLKLFIKPY